MYIVHNYINPKNCSACQSIMGIILCCREETEIIEGEVVEIQIDRPASGTVSYNYNFKWVAHHVKRAHSTYFNGKIARNNNGLLIAFPLN